MTTNTTPELQLLRADQALLNGLARATEARIKATEKLNTVSYSFVASYAQEVAMAAIKADTLLDIVRASGIANRHEVAVQKAAEGNEDFLFDYFYDLRKSLTN